MKRCLVEWRGDTIGVMIGDWFRAGIALFYPPTCIVCGEPIAHRTAGLCMRCHIGLPRTHLHKELDNRSERLFWGKVHLERVSAFCYYHKGDRFAHLLHLLKYKNRKDVGLIMGRMMGEELSQSGFFTDIDIIVPVPLHVKKKRQRGYNQSEVLAAGVSQVTGLPVQSGGVVRNRYTDTQTRKTVFERWDNVKNVFMVQNSELFCSKHILLIDDVLTTGATCAACADALLQVEGVRVSILVLAMADR